MPSGASAPLSSAVPFSGVTLSPPLFGAAAPESTERDREDIRLMRSNTAPSADRISEKVSVPGAAPVGFHSAETENELIFAFFPRSDRSQ